MIGKIVFGQTWTASDGRRYTGGYQPLADNAPKSPPPSESAPNEETSGRNGPAPHPSRRPPPPPAPPPERDWAGELTVNSPDVASSSIAEAIYPILASGRAFSIEIHSVGEVSTVKIEVKADD